MQIIDELEPVRRGPYAGAVGYVGLGRPDARYRHRDPHLRHPGGPGLGPGRRRHRGRLRPGGRNGGRRRRRPGRCCSHWRWPLAGGEAAGQYPRRPRLIRPSCPAARCPSSFSPCPPSVSSAPPATRASSCRPGAAWWSAAGVASDIAIYDPTISRRHAELIVGADGVEVQGPRQLQRHLHQRAAGSRPDDSWPTTPSPSAR